MDLDLENVIRQALGDALAAGKDHLSKPMVLLAYIAVLISGCAPVGYIKPGMSEEEVTRDLSECAEIARHQAFRDIPIMGFRFGSPHPRLHHRDRLFHVVNFRSWL